MNQNTENSFDIVVKLTERCNLACKYCYYFAHEYDATKNPPLIKSEVVQAIPRFLEKSIVKLNIASINIAFHGGEPLLMSKKRFDFMCTTLLDELGDKVKLNFSLQTNAILIDDDWLQLFRKHRVTIGVSLDGDKKSHDLNRIDHKGQGSYEKVIRGIRKLQAAGQAGEPIPYAAIAVYDFAENGTEILKHIINELAIPQLLLNFPRGGEDNPHVKESKRRLANIQLMTRAYLGSFVHPRFHYISGMSEYFLALLSDRGAMVQDRRIATQHHIATISSAGELLIDDNILSLDSSLSQTELNIFDDSLVDLLESSVWQDLNRSIDTSPPACRGCRWYRICRGGKLYNRFSRAAGLQTHSSICEALKIMYLEMETYLLERRVINPTTLNLRLDQAASVTARQTFQALLQKV